MKFEVSEMSTELEKLNAEIAADFKENKCSLFRSSFERLENEVVKKQLEESALALPYLRVACLLLDFYDYADGRNYRTLWQTHNKRADLAKTWEEVYHHAVNQYEVKSKAWILSGECHGQTSDVWRVIKACASKKSEDGADRFDPSSYVNDDVPRQLALILEDYQAGGVGGSEFVSFIEAFLRRGKDTEEWLLPFVERAVQHFPSNIDFTAAAYLKWDGDSTERADLIFGVDHVRGVLSGRLSIDGVVSTVVITTGFKGFALPQTSMDSYEASFMGVTERISSSPVGVYYRYQLGVGARRNWWIKVRADGTFPYNREEILLVFPDGYKGPVVPGHVSIGVVRRTRVYCSGKWYLFVATRIESRPDNAQIIGIGNQSITFAGIAPAIRLGTATANAIWAENAVVVDAATSIEVVGVSDSMSCAWTINGKDVSADGFSLALSLPQGELEESRVKATIRRDGRIYRRLSINVFHMPWQIAEAIRANARLPSGWNLEFVRDEKCEDCIALRVAGRRAALLHGPRNVVLPIYVEDHSIAWWVERDSVQTAVKESFRDVSLFTRMSDLEGAYLCMPSDMATSCLTVSGRKFLVSAWQPKDGVIQIPLDKIIEDMDEGDREFRYAGNIPELHFELDGQLVCVVAAVPKSPTLCRHAEGGELGVFLPNRTKTWSEKFQVLVYRDTPTVPELYSIPERLTVEALEWKRGTGDRFVSVASALDTYLNKNPRGEVFVVLVNEHHWNKYSCTMANPFFLKPETDCQILLVRTDSSQPYSEEEDIVAKRLKSVWGEHLSVLPQGHPLRRTRIASYEGSIKYVECSDYWRDVSGTPSEWKTAFRVMLDSGYNPLLEPDWFNQSIDQLIETVRIRQRRNRVTSQLKEEVLKVLLDNQDARNEGFTGIKGEGLCAALVARRQILNFSPLIPTGRESCFINREQTILSSRNVQRLGIFGMFHSGNGYDTFHVLSGAEGGEMVFSGSGGVEVLKRHPTRGDWRRTDNRRGRLSFRAFALSEPNKQPLIFTFKTSDIDQDEVSWAMSHCSNEEFQRLIDLGVVLSTRLARKWTQELFKGTFDALRAKGCCDIAIARAVGLVVCLQSVLADKDRALCLKVDDSGYDLVLRLTRALFFNKFQEGDDSLWRETMRFTAAYLGIHTYLDISPDQIQDNNF